MSTSRRKTKTPELAPATISEGDGVRYLYSALAQAAGLDAEAAPDLHQYLGGGGGGGA